MFWVFSCLLLICGSTLSTDYLEFFYFKLVISFIGVLLAYIYVCVPCVCLVPVGARRGHQRPWNWSYRRL
jgi:ABC-type sulfate transport system permease component